MDIITHNQANFFITGERDQSFGHEGTITLFELDHPLDLDRHIKGIKVLADDKILAGVWLAHELRGLFGLARFHSDGSVDTSFAEKGLAHGSFADGYDCAGGKVAVQADGHIVMLGWSRKVDINSPKRLVVSRFNKDGAADQSFGRQGCVVIDNSHLGELESDSGDLQLLADGTLLVCATYLTDDSSIGVIIRLNARGEPDNNFNQSGQLEIRHPVFIGTSANALSVQPGCCILVAGGARYSASEVQGYIARYSETGQLDTEFGDTETPGFSTLKITNGTIIFHELIDAGEDKFVGVGLASVGKRNWGMLAGVDATGNPYPTFNGGRPVLTSFNAEHGNEWICAYRQADGKIVAAGGVNRLYTARYLANGSVDRTFGQQGCIQEDTPMKAPPAELQMQTNGRILLATNTLGIGGALGHIYGYHS